MLKTKKFPTHLLYRTIVWGMLTTIFYIICFKLLDLRIDIFLAQHPIKTLQEISEFIGFIFEPNHWIVLLIITALIAAYYLLIRRNYSNTYFLNISLSIFIAAAIATILKFWIGRYRPEAYFDTGLYGFKHFNTKGINHSSPSGHATLAFAGFLSVFSGIKKRPWLYVAILFATVICISRLIIEKHYLGDIILGAYIGIFAYFWSYYFSDLIITLFRKIHT